MKLKNWKVYAFWILLCEGVGLLAGVLTRAGVEIYNAVAVKPPLAPPSWVFPVVWVILYGLMGISAARVTLSEDSKWKQRGLLLFTIQLILNFFWPLFFFNLQAYGFSLVLLAALWIAVLLTILQFYRVDKLAAWLLIPYQVWLTFALYLNFMVLILNP